ncbi:MAG: DUF6132 family protein [Verrucomicrobiota bacterium]|nr:DUF6132 family protein [Verrucomicrobiota bacterium]
MKLVNLLQFWPLLLGAALGALLGYFGQCTSGTCPLTSTLVARRPLWRASRLPLLHRHDEETRKKRARASPEGPTAAARTMIG